MYQISNFTDNDDVKVLSELGAFRVDRVSARSERIAGIGDHSVLQRADECQKASVGLLSAQIPCDDSGRCDAVDARKCQRDHRRKGSRRFLGKGSARQGER